MMTFDPHGTDHGAAFDLELARLEALVVDMEELRSGNPPQRLAGAAPILDHWLVGTRAIPCLVGLSTGHPKLTGEGRPIATSDLWLMSEDRRWARTLSRWYRLGREAGSGPRGS